MQRERDDIPLARFRLLCFSVAFLCCLASACNGSKPPQLVSKPAAKMVVRVSCGDGPALEILKRFAPSFQASSDVSVSVMPRAPGAAPDPQADLWVIEPAAMPALAASNQLQQVPESYREGSEYSWKDLLPVYRSKLLIWGGEKDIFALPVNDQAMLCYYRTDVLEDIKNRADFKAKYHRELTSPATWQDMERMAEFFQGKPRPGLERPCPSLTALPRDDDGLDRWFYLVAAPMVRQAIREDRMHNTRPRDLFSFHYDLDTGKPLLHTAGFVAALEYLCRLERFRAPATADPEASFSQGEAVLCLAPASAIPRFQKSPATKNRFAIARPPGSDTVYGITVGRPPVTAGVNDVPYLGAVGSVMVVPKSTANGADAFKLAAFLSNPKTSRDVVTDPAWGGGVYRRKFEELGWGSFGLEPGQTAELVKILGATYDSGQIVNPLVRLRIPDQATHRAALLREIRAALFSGKKPADAMNDADRAWRELDKMTPEQRIASYRLSVSLF